MSSNVRRLPSLGQIASMSAELDRFKDGRVLRYDQRNRRIESAWRLRHFCTPYGTVVTMSGAAVTCTDLIPAGTFLLGGVTAKNLTAVAGTLTGYYIGVVDAPDLWSRVAVPLTLDTETDISYFTTVNPVYYPVATSVVVTMVGGTATSGFVEVTAWGMPH